jgi:thiol-disulfide isomerase/thioredoxin
MKLQKSFIRYIVLVLFACNSYSAYSQSVELLEFEQLKNSVNKTNDTLYVLNFWATWCRPCVEELPYFEAVNKEYREAPVKFILVNLDFNSKVDSIVKPFILKKKLETRIVHITDTDPNEWINQIDQRWSGAIPATVMYRNGKTVFFKEGPMTQKELEIIKLLVIGIE